MSERWIGITNSSDNVVVVDALVDDGLPIEIQADQTWPLQKGNRPKAYDILHRQLADYIKENEIVRAVIKGTALSTRGVRQGHLFSAELRGVLLAAAASLTTVSVKKKAEVSKNFGERRVDDYISDDEFWNENLTGQNLRNGSREAALLIISEISDQE